MTPGGARPLRLENRKAPYNTIMVEREAIFLDKARESLIGSDSEFSGERYNNCANRAYYACFQAAIVALQRAGIRSRGGQWGHDFVPSQFEGVLINRRHLYPVELRGMLGRLYMLRQTADYDETIVSRTEAERGLRRARAFVMAVTGGEPR